MDERLGRNLSGQPFWQPLGRGPYRVSLRLASREDAVLAAVYGSLQVPSSHLPASRMRLRATQA
jgi:hypothetical protein